MEGVMSWLQRRFYSPKQKSKQFIKTRMSKKRPSCTKKEKRKKKILSEALFPGLFILGIYDWTCIRDLFDGNHSYLFSESQSANERSWNID